MYTEGHRDGAEHHAPVGHSDPAQTGAVQVHTDKLADLAPKLTALLPQTIASMKASSDLSLAAYNSQTAMLEQLEASYS